ncbi:MAG: hypothetical protein HY896_06910 [Deltaproteobacteria bacterium]|nr:hypothetical protein [Deltaproteobacteria bacterium]
MSGDAGSEKTSLFGLVSFRPRLTVVLVFLTLTVAVVGYHITRESAGRKMEAMSREALRIFAAGKKDMANSAQRDPAELEERVREWIGVDVALPRNEKLIVYRGANREKIGTQTAAAVHFTFAEEPCLLMIQRPDAFGGAVAPSTMFSGASFLSWEKDGNSFVIWEREKALFFLVSGADLTQAFDLVRQYFT